ncbi:MAG: hypothetical protein HY747_00535, partial [Elusimicrobia bacterium]|nr:hypothetical protein [Elusimicrobiota bacterium]
MRDEQELFLGADQQGLSSLLDKARRLRLKGCFRQAFSFAERAVIKARRMRRPDLELEAVWELMDCGRLVSPSRRSFLKAMGRRSLVLARGSADPLLQAEAAARWGALHRTLGEHGQAARIIKKLVSGFTIRKDRQLFGYALWNLAFALRMRLELEEAKKRFRESEEIFRRYRDLSGAAYALCGRAGVMRLSGFPSVSLKLYRRAKRLFEKDRDLYGRAYSSCGQANALRRLGRWHQAVGLYNRAARLYRLMGDEINEGYVLWGRFVCCRHLVLIIRA